MSAKDACVRVNRQKTCASIASFTANSDDLMTPALLRQAQKSLRSHLWGKCLVPNTVQIRGTWTTISKGSRRASALRLAALDAIPLAPDCHDRHEAKKQCPWRR